MSQLKESKSNPRGTAPMIVFIIIIAMLSLGATYYFSTYFEQFEDKLPIKVEVLGYGGLSIYVRIENPRNKPVEVVAIYVISSPKDGIDWRSVEDIDGNIVYGDEATYPSLKPGALVIRPLETKDIVINLYEPIVDGDGMCIVKLIMKGGEYYTAPFEI